MHKTLKISASAVAITMMTGVAAYAASPATTPTKALQPHAVATDKTDMDGSVEFQNDAYITLSGKVGKITDGDEFELQHTGGTIMVDTNDTWPDLFQADASTLLKTGDNVTVTGKVDNNLFASNEIEAYQLTVNGPTYNRVYTNNNFGPENDDNYMAYYGSYGTGLEDDQEVRLSGEVSRLIDDESFMLRYGNGEIKVEADDVEFTNAPRLAVGDEIVVFGEVEEGWFSKKTLEADRIILSRAYSQITR
jgi:uncharacterized protein YdeI (BOF family)